MLDPTYRAPDPEPRREPIFNIPRDLLLVMAVLVAIHGLRQIIPQDWDDAILLRLAFEPGTITYAFDPARVTRAVQALSSEGAAGLAQAQWARFILQDYGLQPWTVLTYGLLHASWAHVGLNLLWLLAFGAPVARRLGTPRLILFLCGGSLAGALAHYLTHWLDLQPVIGASAAVSACMGAVLRFVFQPRLPVSSLIGLSDPARDVAARQPLVSLGAMVRDRRAVTFLIAWFATNLLFGIGAISAGLTGGAVAWQAHIGGFLFGLLALPLFDRPAQVVPPALDGPDPEPG
ncbi:MAG TPA: rhomboid family intramembrane serine protease [Lichenihabitans sp.]|nr:rhomboid family intramembrane serine protease [Lichenihabitans sp.]